MSSLASFEFIRFNGIGWALIHFLWQGALIGLCASLLLGGMRKSSANARYIVACSAMLLCLVTFLSTLVLCTVSSWPSNTPASFEAAAVAVGADEVVSGSMADFSPTTSEALTAGQDSLTDSSNTALEFIVFIWCVGIFVMGIRFIRHWYLARTLRRSGIHPLRSQWLELFTAIKARMGVTRKIELLSSSLAETPMVIGWFKPVILVPAAVFTSLDEDELTLILMHELAHIRRQDHLVNFIQGLVEVLLFFHPITWWLSRQIRTEREHCCDDTTIHIVEKPRLLATALVKLESLRMSTFNPTPTTLSAAGGNLMNRIKRIVDPSPARNETSFRWHTPVALAVGALIAAGCIGNAASNAYAAEAAPYTAVQEDARQKRTTGSVNTTCPITGKKVNNDSPTVEVRDYTVAFCCNNCVAKFNDNPREYLTSMREAGVFNQESRGNERPDRRRRGADNENLKIGRILIDLGNAVESGEISAEDAMKRIAGLAERMNMGKKEKKKTITKVDYAEAVEKMTEMVKAGKITRQQMQERLDGMRREMTGASRTRTISREEYAEAQRKMQAMVEKGEISEEDMKRRLGEMRKMVGRNNADGDASKEEYMERIKDRLKMAVESGDMTREEAAEKYMEMEKEYGARSSRKGGEKPKRLTRRDYAEAQAKMQKMVDNGEITEEDMTRRLGEMRRAISEQNRKQQE